jgi:murein endopeptidase
VKVALITAALAAAALAGLLAPDGGTRADSAGDVTDTAPVAQPPEPVVPLEATPVPAPLKRSRALGKPFAGRLVDGNQLPAEGAEFVTWDPIYERSPNRDWRRFGTDRLLDTLADVLADYRARHPDAPRVVIGDLSRPHGGNFGRQFGAPGHASHQNGLDADVYYPRKDGLERAPSSPRMVDRELAQDLADLFVRAGAKFLFVGLHVRLHGPHRIVQPLVLHDDHMHVRIRPG